MPKKHDCRKNFEGSAKAMEASVAVELFSRAPENEAKYSILIGDDDSSTTAKLKDEISYSVEKWSDIQHAKRTLGAHLYKQKGKYKELSDMVIQATCKNFAYALRQNAHRPEDLGQALRNIPNHMFGSHENCSPEWCGYHKVGPAYKHKGLPFGKDLTDESLRHFLDESLAVFADNADKLAPLGNSQQNESLNNTIGSKNIKYRHYGSSASSDFRVAAGVAQYNMGKNYVPNVMKKMNLSPGKFTKRYCFQQDRKRKMDKERKENKTFKRQRLNLRHKRTKTLVQIENREGTQYRTGVAYEASVDCTEIPPALIRPKLCQVEEKLIDTAQLIIFDLETNQPGCLIFPVKY